MTVADLQLRLSKLDPDARIMILDGFNGSGHPREINLGPVDHAVTQDDAENSGDCEGMEGQSVFVMGYGFY